MGPVNIRHHIATITTDSKEDCWAASTAMVMRRHSSAGTDHVKALARAAAVPLDAGTLPDDSVSLLARAVHLGLHDFQSRDVTLEILAQLLQRGPVVAFGFFQYPGKPDAFKHAVAIFALEGDGSAKNTKVSHIDPFSIVNPFSDDWEHYSDFVGDITFLLSY